MWLSVLGGENNLWSTGQKKPFELMKLNLTLKGYLPALRNQTKGAHWSVLHKEKIRAGMALQNALKSSSGSIQDGLLTMTDMTLNGFKMHLSELRLSQTINGTCSLDGLSPSR